jgi:soluble lytic murein transglycosylase-like protein
MAQAGSIMRHWILALALMVLGTPAFAEDSTAAQRPAAQPNVFRSLLSLNPFAGARTEPRRRVRHARVRVSRRVAATAPHSPELDALIAAQARANGVPESLIHRVITRESRYNAAAIGRGGAMGLMQIKHSTARAIGYAGPPSGLLDPETNLTYAVRYLAGALQAAGGDPERGYALYRSGYYKARRGGAVAPRTRTIARAAAHSPGPSLGLRGGTE